MSYSIDVEKQKIMGELFGELILELFGRLILNVIGETCIAIAGISLDAPLKLMGINISWGFCYHNHRFAAIMNMILLFLIPFHIYNWGLSNSLFIYLSLILFIIVVLYSMNANFEFLKKPSDLLDDEFTK